MAIGQFSFRTSVVLSLLAPLMLVVGRELASSQPDWWPGAALNWLYMAAPQLTAVLVCAVHGPARRFAWLPLLLLTFVLFAFQAWIIWWVPRNESGLAWILYFPVQLGVVALTALAQWLANRKHRDVRISGDA